jgi:hypothetical protein
MCESRETIPLRYLDLWSSRDITPEHLAARVCCLQLKQISNIIIMVTFLNFTLLAFVTNFLQLTAHLKNHSGHLYFIIIITSKFEHFIMLTFDINFLQLTAHFKYVS